ncbi:MAG: outer membrane protein [Alphaproteobacteria bacterium]
MKLSIATSAILLAASTAFAGSMDTSAGAESSWAGTYAGGQFAFGSGANDYYGDGTGSSSIYVLEGTAYGVFAGYRKDMGSYLVGGEVSILAGPDLFETGYEGSYYYEGLIDLKVTVGYEIGSTLVHASAGYAVSVFTGSGDSNTLGGLLVGAGVDVAVSDRTFVGVEYVYREMRNDNFWAVDDGVNGMVGTAQVRAGYRF